MMYSCIFFSLKNLKKIKVVGNPERQAHWCVKQYMSHGFEIAYEVYMFFILFTIPLIVMLVTYIRISIEIWDVVSKRAVLRSGRYAPSY